MHWTQDPKNHARVVAMAKRNAATRKANKMASTKTISKKRTLLTELAIRGARAEITELEERITSLKVFLARA